MAEFFIYGVEQQNLCKQIRAEDRDWRFLGIFASNSLQWVATLFGCMHQSITSIPLYITLSNDAIRFVIDQTQLGTMAISQNYLQRFIDLKAGDEEGKMKSLTDLIVLDPGVAISKDLQIAATKVGLNLHMFEDLVKQGQQLAKGARPE